MSADYTGTKWGQVGYGTSGGVVTWSFASTLGTLFDFTSYITDSVYQSAIRAAFTTWETVANIDFQEVADSQAADIRLGWGTIDGRGNTIGLSQWSYSGTTTQHSEIIFDTVEPWSLAPSSKGYYFYATALHEIGHSIGLDHTAVADSIMYPELGDQTGLSNYDVELITYLYGSASKFLVGTAGADILTGGSSADHIYGLGGNDTLSGGGGIDLIEGGDGHDLLKGEGDGDYLLGGAGNDVLEGGAGYDRLYGQEGNDTLKGGDDTDEAFGGIGDDIIHGEAGGDWLLGEDGADQIYGGAGYDRLYGGAGNDLLDGGTNVAGDLLDELFGEAGNDILRGGAGSDWLIGGAGNDTLTGGSGADNFVFAGLGNGVDHITDYSYGDYDVIRTNGASYSVFQNGGNTVIYFGADATGEAAIVVDNFVGTLWLA